MSKGGIIAGAALAIVIGSSAGGYFYVESKVNALVDTLIANAAQNNAVKSITYGEKQVDLTANAITLHDFKMANDLNELLSSTMTMDGLSMTGSAQTTFESVTLNGVWGIVFGGSEIASIEAINGSSNVHMTQTMENATVSTTVGNESNSQQVDRVTTTLTANTKMPRLIMQGLDIKPLMGAEAGIEQLQKVSLTSYEAKDVKTDLTMAMETMGKNAKPVPPMNVQYTVGRMYGNHISLTAIDLAVAENILVTSKMPTPEMEPLTFEIGEVSLSQTEMVDFFPIKATYSIKDMVFKTPKNVDPQMAMTMAMLGIQEFNFDMTVHFAWNEGDKSFTLAPFQFGLKKVGAIDFSVNMSSLPSMDELVAAQKRLNQSRQPTPEQMKSLSPEELQAMAEKQAAELKAEFSTLFADAALKRVALGYKDEGALKTFIAMQAMQLGGDVNILAQGIAQQAKALVTATHGAEKAKEVAQKLAAFINNPTELRIGLNSATPVKFTDLQKDIDANGPMALRQFQLDVIGGN